MRAAGIAIAAEPASVPLAANLLPNLNHSWLVTPNEAKASPRASSCTAGRSARRPPTPPIIWRGRRLRHGFCCILGANAWRRCWRSLSTYVGP